MRELSFTPEYRCASRRKKREFRFGFASTIGIVQVTGNVLEQIALTSSSKALYRPPSSVHSGWPTHFNSLAAVPMIGKLPAHGETAGKRHGCHSIFCRNVAISYVDRSPGNGSVRSFWPARCLVLPPPKVDVPRQGIFPIDPSGLIH